MKVKCDCPFCWKSYEIDLDEEEINELSLLN